MSALPKEVLREMIKDGNLKTAGDLHSFLKDMFKDVIQEMLEADMVSKITDKILPRIKEWPNRALKPIYPFVFMDAIHY